MTSEKLSKLLMLPYFSSEKCKTFKGHIEGLNDAVLKMKSYLEQANKRATYRNTSVEPVRSLTDNFSFCIKPATKVSELRGCYKKLAAHCEKLQAYQFLDLIDFEPIDIIERRKWLNYLQLPFEFGLFVYSHGNSVGNLNVIWKQPPEEERSSTLDIKCINEIKGLIPVFATRAMKKDFIERYNGSTKLKPVIARSMLRYLTNAELTAENLAEKQIDERLDLILRTDDPKLILDLRQNNGRIANPKYDDFWSELGTMVNEQSVVNDNLQKTYSSIHAPGHLC